MSNFSVLKLLIYFRVILYNNFTLKIEENGKILSHYPLSTNTTEKILSVPVYRVNSSGICVFQEK
jgi:hypothetical protein